MKAQPIPRLGQIIYPETSRIKEQTLVNLVRVSVLSFCLGFWYLIYKMLKTLFQGQRKEKGSTFLQIDYTVGSKEKQAKAKEGLVFSLLPLFIGVAAGSIPCQAGGDL